MSTDGNGNTNCSNLTDCYNCKNSSNCRHPRHLRSCNPNAVVMNCWLTARVPSTGNGCNRLNNCSNMNNSDVSAANVSLS